MFNQKFLTLFYKGTKKQQYVDAAGNTALFLSLILPFLLALATFLGFVQNYVAAVQSMNFCGLSISLLGNIQMPYEILQNTLQGISILTIVTAILFRVTKCPVFGAVLIVDAIAGYVKSIPAVSSFVTFNQTPILDHLPLLSFVFLILIVTVYSLGTAASVNVTIDLFAYQKQKKAIMENLAADSGTEALIQSLPFGKRTFDFRIVDKDMLHRSLHGFVRSGSVQPSAGVTLADRTGRKLGEAVVMKILSSQTGAEIPLASAGAEFSLLLDACDSDALHKAVFLYAETE